MNSVISVVVLVVAVGVVAPVVIVTETIIIVIVAMMANIKPAIRYGLHFPFNKIIIFNSLVK